MAYAGIAGLPPQAGLYTLLAALLVYAVFGTSRHLVVQATSATAALLASAVAAALVASAAAVASDPESYQTLRVGLRAGHRLGLSGGRAGAAGLHHAVPLQAGDGRLRDRPGYLRGRGPAQQALRCGKTRGQHGGEAAGDHQGAAAGQLGCLCHGSRRAGGALPAAALEQEDPGRPRGAVRRHRAERGAGSQRQVRRRDRGHAAAGAANTDLPGGAVHDLSGHGAAGHGRIAGGLQRGPGRGARVCREARLRGRREPGIERPRRGQRGELRCSAACLRPAACRPRPSKKGRAPAPR